MNGEKKKVVGKDLIVPPEELISEGKTLVKTEIPYVTALQVQKPRDIDQVIDAIKRECEFGGDDLYYGWTLQRGKSAGKKIEGGSIGLATSLARAYGNVWIPVTMQETEEAFLFTATFIDLETGFNLQRIFRTDRTGDIPGEYEPARKEDIKFQIGQSKAIRNVILNGGIPRWLVNSAVKWAKDAVINNITKEGLAKATANAIDFFAKNGIKEKDLIDYIGAPKTNWTAENIAHLRGIAQRLKDEDISPEQALAEMKEAKSEEPVSVEKILNGKNKKGKPAKTEAKKKEPAGKQKVEIFHCENPKCKVKVPPGEVEESKKEFDGLILCFDCQMLMREGQLTIARK